MRKTVTAACSFVTGYRAGCLRRGHGRHGGCHYTLGGRRGGRQVGAFRVVTGRARSEVRLGQDSDVRFGAGRHGWRRGHGRRAGVCMQGVRVQPGCVRARPCSIARFGDSCRGRRDRISARQWIVDSGRKLSRLERRNWRRARTAASCPRRVADTSWGRARWNRAHTEGIIGPVNGRCQWSVAKDCRSNGGIGVAHARSQLGTRTHVSWHDGIATGGRCGGSPPAQGRAGTARPSNGSGHWPAVSDQWPGTAGTGYDSVVP